MSWLQSTLWKSFVKQYLPNISGEQVFSVVKNLQVTVMSKAFYKYSFVSERHLFPARTTLCDGAGSLRSGSGLLRKLIFCSCTHLVYAKHVRSPWDFEKLVWVGCCTLIPPFCLFSELMLPSYLGLEFLPQRGILLFDIWSLFCV